MTCRSIVLLLGLPFFGCAANAELGYADSAVSANASAQASGAGPGDSTPGPAELGGRRLRPDACDGIDLAPDYDERSVDHLIAFLKGRGVTPETVEARGDLVYLDIKGPSGSVRLRVAILKSASEAGRELHGALLQHGHGAWGVHRSNLAVLAPQNTSFDEAVGFATKTQLACWGVLTVTGRDDTFVVPGGYTEI